LFGWCGGCVPMTDADGDGVHTVTVDLAEGAFEYKYAVDGFAGQEDLIDDMVNGGTCAPITDYYSYANRQFNVNQDYTLEEESVQNGDFSNSGSWYTNTNWIISGGFAYSTGSSNFNYNGQIINNGSTLAGELYLVTYDIAALTQGSYQVSIGGTQGEIRNAIGTYTEVLRTDYGGAMSIIPLSNAIGGIDNVSAILISNVTSNTNDAYGSCSECLVGCMDPLAWNYDSLAGGDDGSCLYSSDCSNTIPTNLGVNWTTDTKASINWDNMNVGDCRVIKYFTRYRTGGSNS